MSREQEELWLDDMMLDGESVYQESWAGRLTGQLDIVALEWAIGQVIARHDVLHTRLIEVAGEPVQVVTDPGPLRLVPLPCSPAALPGELMRITAEPLRLDEAPIRPWLLRLSPDEFVLVVQLHHAAIDDWSLNIFQRELMLFYTAAVRGDPPALEPMRMQAGELAVAQRAAELDPADIAYWRERVRAAPMSGAIPPDRPGSAELPHRARRHCFRLSPSLGQAVRAASRTLRTTPLTVFAASMAALLWQYSRPDEVILGTPVSLRGKAATDDMIGYLCNLLPLRLRLGPSTSFRMLTNAAKTEVLGALRHRAVPYSQVVRMARRPADAGASPLCDTILVVDDMRWEPFSLPGLTTERIYVPPAKAKCAVLVNLVADDNGGYAGFWDYDADVYDAAGAARVAHRYTTLLADCVAELDEPLGRICSRVPTPEDSNLEETGRIDHLNNLVHDRHE